MVDEQLLEVLACPECKGELQMLGNNLACSECDEEFEVEEGIPKFL